MEVKVSCIFVERNATFRYVYHFIRKCVFHMYVTIAVGNGRSLSNLLSQGARRGTGKEEENVSGFQGIHCGMFINL